MTQIYVLTRHELIGDEFYDMDILGAFTTPQKSAEALKQLCKQRKQYYYDSPHSDKVFYVIEEHIVDSCAYALDHESGTVEATLEELCKEGYVETLIGEDGEFSFRLTDKGIAQAKKDKSILKELNGGDKGSTDIQE